LRINWSKYFTGQIAFCSANTVKTKQTPFNGLFSRITWVSQQQKAETNLDFNEAKDDWAAVTSAGSYANHLHLNPEKNNHTSTLSVNFFTG